MDDGRTPGPEEVDRQGAHRGTSLREQIRRELGVMFSRRTQPIPVRVAKWVVFLAVPGRRAGAPRDAVVPGMGVRAPDRGDHGAPFLPLHDRRLDAALGRVGRRGGRPTPDRGVGPRVGPRRQAGTRGAIGLRKPPASSGPSVAGIAHRPRGTLVQQDSWPSLCTRLWARCWRRTSENANSAKFVFLHMKRGHEASERTNTYSRADPALAVDVDRSTLVTLDSCICYQ
jgi:hypothetical protein